DGPAHFVQTGFEQFLGVERGLAREQFVEQHAQAVNVAAGIDVHTRELRLLGTHVSGCAEKLLEPGEDGLLRQLHLRGLGDAEINDLGHGHAIIGGDQNVRGLEITMYDAFWWACWTAWRTCVNRSSRSRADK